MQRTDLRAAYANHLRRCKFREMRRTPLRAARANRVFCADEKHIRTENTVIVNTRRRVGGYTRSPIACGWLFIRAQSTIRADGFSSAQNRNRVLREGAI
jgi:hypothetical protein